VKKSPASILRFHGVRGSRPFHVTDLLGYGGNSTCIEIDCGLDFIVAIDAGSGLQHIANRLGEHPTRKKIHLLITHTHWDHVLFLPFMRQLANPECDIHIHAPDISGRPFSDLFAMLFTKGRLPIPGDHTQIVKSKLTFHRIKADHEFLIEGKCKVETIQVNHQHTTLGYKISVGDSNLAVITDAATIRHGNYLGTGMQKRASVIGNEAFEREYNEKLIHWLRDVHTLVFDTHFNAKNMKSDWGHASPDIAVDLCAKAKIKRLFMFHHAPEDNDNKVALKQIYARNLAAAFGIEIINAREGDEWPLKSA
jgi:phosphoribosyl 1,2-cyclic phosphodiesterase